MGNKTALVGNNLINLIGLAAIVSLIGAYRWYSGKKQAEDFLNLN